ncbi:MAG: DUF917 domain-containing protein [Bacillota bacterium]
MSVWHITAEDVDALLEGLALFGTGGGGSPAWGRAIMERDLARGRQYTLIPPDEVPDEALVVSGGYMGSVKVLDAMGFDEVAEGWEARFELREALRVMEEILGRRVDYVVPFELGGLNTPVVLSLGARAGIPVVDGDALGRAAPETQMTSFIGHGISLTPMPLVDRAGNTVVVKEAVDPVYPDVLGRWVITQGGGTGANNHYPMSGRQLKAAVIPGTISMALNAGRVVRRAREQGRDPVAAFARFAGGTVLFRGMVAEVAGEDRFGHYLTSVTVRGVGEDTGATMRLVIKNETMAAWIDDQLAAVLPDLVCMLEPETGRGIMSVDLRAGLPMAAVAIPCHPRLRAALATPQGAAAFSGARYGCPDIRYQPLEELLARLGKPLPGTAGSGREEG